MGNDILIVDDNIANLKTLESFFLKEGFDVRCATNGKTALMIASNLPPAIILLDIQMPEMNGFEVCGELKKNPDLKDVPVLFISAETSVDEKVKAFQHGAVDYITKPFQFEETLARVKTHLHIVNLKNNLEQSNRELTGTVNQLKKTQEQLIKSAKLASIGTLIAGISHEINNPLNYILTGIPALEKTAGKLKNLIPDSDPAVNQYLNMISEILASIKTGALKTSEIVKGLRDFTRSDSGIAENLNVNDCIQLALLILHNEYKDQIEIVKNLSGLPSIRGYKNRIEQVFVNIIKNSIDAIFSRGKTGKITIETEISKVNEISMIIARICDTGGGIPEKDIPRIFDPFFSTKEVGKGVGLGLSISYQIILNHNGSIEFKNTGEGVCFEVKLPMDGVVRSSDE